MPVIPHLSSARVTTLATLSLCLALSACGGGGDADAGAVADNPQIPPVTQPVTPPVTTPTTPPTASEQDLAGFTAAWMSYQMLASVNMLQMAAGGTGSCGLGGTVAYDAVAGTSTLDQCHTRAFPYQVYSGRNSISQLVSNADRSQVSAAIRSPSVRVVSADTGTLEYTITDGEITGDVVSSESGDRFSFTATGLRIRAGQASDYTISNAGSTSTTVVFRNGQPERTSNNLVYTVSNGTSTWQVTVMSPMHEAGADRPDQGHLMIVRLGALQALNATFANNSITLSGGETGTTRPLAWSDASLQAALAAARK